MTAQALGGSGSVSTQIGIRTIAELIVQDGAGSTGWIYLDVIEGGENQDEIIRNMLEAAEPLVRMGLHRATVEVGRFRAIANATRRGEQGEVIKISDIREDTLFKVRRRSLLS